MPAFINSEDLSQLLGGGTPHALLDVREQGEFNAAHIHGSSWLPRRRIELDAGSLVPYAGTDVVVCDDDGRRAALAAATLVGLGYTSVRVLRGGLNRWVTDGLPTEWGVNVVSKAFGEHVFESEELLEVTPDELHGWMDAGRKLVLLDTRTPEEHAFATIPGSRSMPNGEIALRFGELDIPDDATVVVHCAGRTRSIIGAQTLRRVGIPNVYALRNGTMGWTMAGYEVESGSDRTELPDVSPDGAASAAQQAQRIAAEDGVRYLSVDELRSLMATSAHQNVYLIDPRTREEYEAGHIPGFRWFPGGQAVQRSDEVMAVKPGHVVFACDGTVRSSMTASWFRQIGFPNVYAVRGGTEAWVASGHQLEDGVPLLTYTDERVAAITTVGASLLSDALREAHPPTVVFVGTSREFSAGHVPGAHWVPRGSLEFQIEEVAPDRTKQVTLTSSDELQSRLAAATLLGMGYRKVNALAGGFRSWRDAGLPARTGLAGLMSPPNDVVLAGTERTYAEMMQYLRWETELGHHPLA